MPVIINGTTGITNVNGSASTPAETGTDTDTGIYYGTNTVGLATNGTNALFIDASQNVGIGTSSPAAKLDVRTAAGTAVQQNLYTGSSAASATLQFAQVGSVGWNTGITATTGDFQIDINTGGIGYKIVRSATAINYHSWLTAGSERMRIDSSGNVGIGTSSPSSYGSPLSVYAATNPTLAIASGNANAYLRLYSTSDNNMYLTNTGGSMTMITANSERMRIDSSGNVGIGQTSQVWDEKLGVRLATSGSGTVGLGVYSASTTYASSMIRVQAETGGSGWKMYEGRANGGSQLFWVDGSGGAYFAGNVGIGTSSPSYKLDVRSTLAVLDGSSNIGFYANGSAYTQIWQTLQSTNDFIIQTTASKYISFGINSAEKVRIDTSGNLLIGTGGGSVPNGTSVYGSAFDDNGANTKRLRLASSVTTTIQLVSFYNPNGNVGNITTNASATAYATSSDYRLKNTIAPMTGALAKVQALKPVTYKWNADNSDGQGFIAHELAEVVPQCVIGEKDAVDDDGNPVYQGIDTSFLVATLTAAIQEQQALITALTARIEALESN